MCVCVGVVIIDIIMPIQHQHGGLYQWIEKVVVMLTYLHENELFLLYKY